jgi:CubicO group peptidase (beta-lactamase class C family)
MRYIIKYEEENKEDKMINYRGYLGILFLLLTLLISMSCKQGDDNNKSDNRIVYTYQVPVQENDGWVTTSLSAVGIDTATITNLMNFLLNRERHYIHSILIVKDGNLVFEEYFSGEDAVITAEALNFVYRDFDRNTLHFQASVSKSITSILFGIAIDKGFIRGIDGKMFSYFPGYADLNDAEKDKITVAHMLNMTTGLPWDDSTYPHDDPRSDEYKVLMGEDPVGFVLGLPVVEPPGTNFEYNSGTTVFLGEIVRKTSGLLLPDFAQQYLFTPLGIFSFSWINCFNSDGVCFASGGLYLRSRDMAKIGQLFLNEGMWNGTSIVSAEWVRDSTRASIVPPGGSSPLHEIVTGYGHQWWMVTFSGSNMSGYMAAGWGGQYIIVFPDLEMVVIFTQGDFGFDEVDVFYSIFYDYIIPAVQ